MSNYNYSDFEKLKKPQPSLVPISSGEEQCTNGSTWGPSVRFDYLIYYVVSGKGVFFCGTNKYQLKKGHFFVVFPNTIVKYRADEGDPWHGIWVNFDGAEAKGILQSMGISIHSPVKKVQKGSEVVEVLRQMPRENTDNLSNNLMFSAKLYELMSYLAKDIRQTSSKEGDYFENAVQYIKTHYREPLTVEGVAKYIGVSRKYLFAIFKNILGLSPKDYIVNYRIEMAKELLMNKDVSVGSVAYSVGYEDPLNFSKMFKGKTGLSPREYRKNHGIEE